MASRQLVRPPSILSATILVLKCYGKCRGWEIKINTLSYSSPDEAFFAVTVCPIIGYILAQHFTILEQFWQIGARFRHNRNASVSLPLRHAAEQNTCDVLTSTDGDGNVTTNTYDGDQLAKTLVRRLPPLGRAICGVGQDPAGV